MDYMEKCIALSEVLMDDDVNTTGQAVITCLTAFLVSTGGDKPTAMEGAETLFLDIKDEVENFDFSKIADA